MRRWISAATASALALTLAISPALAQLTHTDLLVLARAVGFIENFHPGAIQVGIVFSPGSAQSEQQAREVASLMESGLRVGNLVLKPTLVPLGRTQRANVALFFLTQGVGAQARELAGVSRVRKIPCVTFDIAQVRNGSCTMGVRTHPKIEVLVNRAAAEASGTEFAAVFRIMITEI